MNLKTKAVFFDFDGVLVASMPSHVLAWSAVLGELGIVLDDLYFQLHEGEKAEETVSRLLQEHGITLGGPEQAALIERKRVLYRKQAPRGLIPGARRLIDALAEQTIACAVVTGSLRTNVEAALSPGEVTLFDFMISAEMYEKGKPDPAPYLAALKRSGADSSECMVLENAPLGIRSAKSAGLRTVAITSTLSERYLHEADVVISDYHELLTYL